MPLTHFFSTYIPQIEAALKTYTTFDTPDSRQILQNAIQYSVMAGGKRVRPLLCIASFSMFGSDTQKIMPLAVAMELIHTYSLMHDDLPAMDNDDLRRGKPTCHKKFGEDIAILAGDTLNTFAFELVASDLPQHYPADRVISVMALMGQAFGIQGMSGGQVMDLQSPQHSQDEAYLQKTHQLKTGAMLQACVTLPSILENASPSELKSISDFGQNLGLLFQIVDDILDVEGEASKIGKSPNKDMSQQKLTYVSLWGLEGAKKAANQTADQAKSALSHLSLDTQILDDFITFILNRQA